MLSLFIRGFCKLQANLAGINGAKIRLFLRRVLRVYENPYVFLAYGLFVEISKALLLNGKSSTNLLILTCKWQFAQCDPPHCRIFAFMFVCVLPVLISNQGNIWPSGLLWFRFCTFSFSLT